MQVAGSNDEQPEAATAQPLDVSDVTVGEPSDQRSVAVQQKENAETDTIVEPLPSPTVAVSQPSTPPLDPTDSRTEAAQPASSSSPAALSPSTPPLVKLTPAHFKPSALLGEGSYSQVYLVHSLLDQQQYAMKVLNKAHLQRHNRTTVAYAEKAALTHCSHPNIIRLYHTFQDHSSLYFILELCDGGDVASLIEEREDGGLPHQLVVYYAAQLLHCLHYLHHTAHIIHRDIKPDNMMLSATGQLKLVDFGTAKLLDSNHTSSTNSPAPPASPKKHSFVGTAAYVAPEILTSTQPHSYAVDQWSAGATLYQLITGRLPFHAASEYLTFQRILSGGRVEWLDGEGMDGGRQLVERLMERDESRRLGVRADDWEEVKRMQLFEGVQWERLDEWRMVPVRQAGGGGKKYSVMSEESLVGWRNSVSRMGGDETKEDSDMGMAKGSISGEAVAGGSVNLEERRGERIHDRMLDSYRGSRLSVQREGRESDSAEVKRTDESKEERKESHSHSHVPTQHSASVGYSGSAPSSSFQSHLQPGEALTLCSAIRRLGRPSSFSCCLPWLSPSPMAASSAATHLLLTSTRRLLLVNLTTGECLWQHPMAAVPLVQREQPRPKQAIDATCEVLIIDSDRWQLLDGTKSGDWVEEWLQARYGVRR